MARNVLTKLTHYLEVCLCQGFDCALLNSKIRPGFESWRPRPDVRRPPHDNSRSHPHRTAFALGEQASLGSDSARSGDRCCGGDRCGHLRERNQRLRGGEDFQSRCRCFHHQQSHSGHYQHRPVSRGPEAQGSHHGGLPGGAGVLQALRHDWRLCHQHQRPCEIWGRIHQRHLDSGADALDGSDSRSRSHRRPHGQRER